MSNRVTSRQPASTVKLSIVIVSWNTLDLLVQCLNSIYDPAPSMEFETLVVDNASTDGSAVAVRELYPHVRLIENAENVGFARANNQAIRQANGQYILLLNPDTLVIPGALDMLVSFMDEYPEAGLAGARTLNPDHTLQASCYPAPTLSREIWRLLHLDAIVPYGAYRMSDWPVDLPRRVEALLGACILVRPAVFEQIGLFDADYFFTAEEIDLCRRAARAGWTIYWVPQAQIIHYGGQSSRLIAEKAFLLLYEGKVMYFRKQLGSLNAVLYKLALALASLLRISAAPFILVEPAARRERHRVLLSRYCRLLRALPGM